MKKFRIFALIGILNALTGVFDPSISAEKEAILSTQKNPLQLSENLPKILIEAKESERPLFLVFDKFRCDNCKIVKANNIKPFEAGVLKDHFHWVGIDKKFSLSNVYEVYHVPSSFIVDHEDISEEHIIGAVEPAAFREMLGSPSKTRDDGNKVMTEQSNSKALNSSEVPTDNSSGGYREKDICYAHVGYGPLKVQSQSPFQSLRLGLTPRSPSTLTKNSFEASLHETWVNVWSFERGRDRIDYESLQSVLTVKYGITDTLDAELSVYDRRRFGGVMDSFIEGFHDTLGLDQAGRDEFAKGDFAIELNSYKDQPAVTLDEGDKGVFSQNALFTIQHNITCGTKYFPALSYAFTGRYGEAVDFEDSYFFDMEVSVAAARRFGSIYGYLSFGYVWFGRDDVMGIKLDKTLFSLLCAIEWQYSPKQSLLIQYLLSEGAAEDWRDFSYPSHEVAIGWKGEIFRGMVLEIGLIENILNYENSPDFGIHVGLVRRF
ncbi:MAG: DUF3187 family protein [Thermodesulfobacteriota bacterium]|nr:DUF3187 family protein [Thermodesulfobacteriota bacterium]